MNCEKMHTYLLPQLQHLKPLEIRQVFPLLPLFPLLGPRTLLPLALHLLLLPRSLDGPPTGTSGEFLDHERSQNGIVEGGRVSRHGEV